MEGGSSYSNGFVWPQRNYSCSFCKRQFNSAQALGGHMNVHRRDRAMLIQLPSWVFDHCPNPNPKSQPNPNFSSSSSATFATNRNYTPQRPFHRLSSSPGSASLTSSSGGDKKSTEQIESSVPLFEDLAKKKRKNAVEIDKFKKDPYAYDQIEVLKHNHEVISLDLEIGCKDSKEVLDLELRLGCF